MFPTPTKGSSLLLAFRARQQRILIIGSGLLAASRAFAALEADFEVIILGKGGIEEACAEVKWRVEQGQCKFVDWDALPASSTQQEQVTFNAFLASFSSISLASITDTTISNTQRRTKSSATTFYRILKSHNIPVNTSDIPELCDYSFTSTHRFDDPQTGDKTPLQIGVTTNGQGCRLAGRIRRDIVSKLPKEIGTSAVKLGQLRTMAKSSSTAEEVEEEDEVNEDSPPSTPNRPVPPRNTTSSETISQSARRRMKWVAQVSEYWPISKLATMSEQEMNSILLGENTSAQQDVFGGEVVSKHALDVPKKGKILLVGSGPGHPQLLTLATHTALTKLADLVLSDKLVPAAVLALIPEQVQVRIARKFPGNAEGAQQEMMEAAIEAAKKGLTVVRLKQGDPVVYGRAGEEVLYFRRHGFEPLIIPGVSSALAAPTFAGVPVTQRGVAESFIVCTGVGRQGKEIQFPAYERGRTLVVLMGVARLPQVIQALTNENDVVRREGAVYPGNTPIAIIERASMPDQRVLTSTLENIVEALANSGEQRPPGMMVIGWSVLALSGQGDVSVLDEGEDKKDAERVQRWLDNQGWRVHEGLDSGWEDL